MLLSLRLLMIGALLAFLGVSATRVLTIVGQFGFPNSLDPLLTANHFLMVLGVDRPAARIERVLSDLPPGEHLLLVAPDAEPFAGQVRLTLTYLAYPRKLSSVLCTGQMQGKTHGENSPSGVDTLVFFKLPAIDPGENAVSVGNMVFVRRKSASPWQSFCR
jgi:hypothetical protein